MRRLGGALIIGLEGKPQGFTCCAALALAEAENYVTQLNTGSSPSAMGRWSVGAAGAYVPLISDMEVIDPTSLEPVLVHVFPSETGAVLYKILTPRNRRRTVESEETEDETLMMPFAPINAVPLPTGIGPVVPDFVPVPL